MIQILDVTKRYDDHMALRDVTVSVEKGEMVFLTGPSGSGKTTLLRLVYAAEKPDTGSVSVAGWETQELGESSIPLLRRNIGVVFQDFRLLDKRNIFENVALALRIRGVGEKEVKAKVHGALKEVNLRHKSDAYPKALSGGEQQRVVIARAIVAEPAVVLADEPTGNLDPATAADVMKTFKEINARGTTILIATHNRELYKHTGRRVFTLNAGSLVGEELG
jgi:cell division transport system ATP-binding protein